MLNLSTETELDADRYAESLEDLLSKYSEMLENETDNTKQTVQGDHVRIFWEEEVTSESAAETAIEVTISPDTFPGTYRVVGDTFMRNINGKDYPFQFVIPKAKIQSETTLTMEAEGDPTVIGMTLKDYDNKAEEAKARVAALCAKYPLYE